MNGEDLLFIAGVQIATAGVILAHLGTNKFSPRITEIQAFSMLVAGLALVVGAMYFWRRFDSVKGVFAQ